MKRIIFILGIVCLILLSGCAVNKTNIICPAFKLKFENETTQVYMDEGVCVIEIKNATNLYYVRCNDLTSEYYFLIKTYEGVETFDDLREECKFTKISD